MKLKAIILLFILSFLFFGFSSQQVKPVLLLTNAKTNKSINVCGSYNPDKVEAILGKAITLDKDLYDKEEETVFTFHYDGLVIEMQNELVKQVTITNKKWKLNKFTLGTLIEEVALKHERHDAKFVTDRRFKIKDSKGVIFAEIDHLQRITKLGVVFN